MAAPCHPDVDNNDSLLIKELLKSHQFLTVINSDNLMKVKCNLTNHELPYRLDAIEKHVQGKKYQKLSEIQGFDYDKYVPHLVPSTKRKREHQLFCTLTWRHITRSPTDVLRHVNGRRYKTALQRYEHCQREIIPFKARRGRNAAKRDSEPRGHNRQETTDFDEESICEESNDSMSDLYPADMFEDDEDNAAEPITVEPKKQKATATSLKKRHAETKTKGQAKREQQQHRKKKRTT
ncbi:PREDICTED: surfeit locus protein 2-like [Priapulus caudatus]|uniref:Surfeit locus protein 2-like n=1 Tax=Priapulus caudatus TaxID=37621 RepID=A0ABM1F2H8_PRICU|nr:PREDICTED: surfeit locus protein 2-like [Priapulus caudatus]